MPDHESAALSSAVVLVVDDDPAVRSALTFSLEIEGYAVRTYANAQALLHEPELPAHGCLVLDQATPGISGLELLALLRDRGIGLPAILITTAPSLPVRQRAASAGADLVEKPLLGNALLDAIQAALTPGA